MELGKRMGEEQRREERKRGRVESDLHVPDPNKSVTVPKYQ